MKLSSKSKKLTPIMVGQIKNITIFEQHTVLLFDLVEIIERYT